MKQVIDLLPYVTAGYEFFAHAIPTKKNWSILHKVFKALVFVSEFLNRNKTTGVKLPLIAIVLTISFASCKVIKTTSIDCKSQRMIPVTFVPDSGAAYTVNVPFCDTVLIHTKPAQ